MTKKHMLLMAACCLIPITAIVAVGALAIPVSSITPIAIALICPLMMLFMMRGMHHGDEQHHDHQAAAPIKPKQIGSGVDQSSR
jgi:Protein of unknown function (DUF2933)